MAENPQARVKERDIANMARSMGRDMPPALKERILSQTVEKSKAKEQDKAQSKDKGKGRDKGKEMEM